MEPVDTSQSCKLWLKFADEKKQRLLEIMNYLQNCLKGIFGRLADSKILDPIKLEILKIGEENIHQSKPSQKKKSLKILADDEMDILTLYKTFLEAKGKEITTVTDGHKCVEMYKRKNKLYVSGNYFDIVILDQKMPIMWSNTSSENGFSNNCNCRDSIP